MINYLERHYQQVQLVICKAEYEAWVIRLEEMRLVTDREGELGRATAYITIILSLYLAALAATLLRETYKVWRSFFDY